MLCALPLVAIFPKPGDPWIGAQLVLAVLLGGAIGKCMLALQERIGTQQLFNQTFQQNIVGFLKEPIVCRSLYCNEMLIHCKSSLYISAI